MDKHIKVDEQIKHLEKVLNVKFENKKVAKKFLEKNSYFYVVKQSKPYFLIKNTNYKKYYQKSIALEWKDVYLKNLEITKKLCSNIAMYEIEMTSIFSYYLYGNFNAFSDEKKNKYYKKLLKTLKIKLKKDFFAGTSLSEDGREIYINEVKVPLNNELFIKYPNFFMLTFREATFNEKIDCIKLIEDEKTLEILSFNKFKTYYSKSSSKASEFKKELSLILALRNHIYHGHLWTYCQRTDADVGARKEIINGLTNYQDESYIDKMIMQCEFYFSCKKKKNQM